MKIQLICLAVIVAMVGAATLTDRDKRDLLGLLNNKLDEHYGAPAYYPPHKAFDLWAFKRAIVDALVQAIKAIKGGIIAAKGALIKAKGNIISTKGQIIATKGQAIVNFGKHLATKALLPDEHHTSPGISYAFPSVSYTAPSAPSLTYGIPSKPAPSYLPPTAPTAPATAYGLPKKPLSTYAVPTKVSKFPQLPDGVQAGLIVLKPIHVPTTSHTLPEAPLAPTGSHLPGPGLNAYLPPPAPSAASYGSPTAGSFGPLATSYGTPLDTYAAGSEQLLSLIAAPGKAEEKGDGDQAVSIQSSIGYSLPSITYTLTNAKKTT